MNQCIVNIVGHMIFIAFNQIVESGFVEIWQKGNKISPMIRNTFTQTNFINMDIPPVKGKYRIEIEMDGQHITKAITIN